MKKSIKRNNKSVRLTDEVFQYVESFEGGGFNEKFENLVLFCMRSESQRREELQHLEKRIEEKRKILDALTKIDWTVNAMVSQVKTFRNRMDGYFSDLETTSHFDN